MPDVLTDDHSTVANMEEDTENIGLLSLDPGLEAYKDHFIYRVRGYVDKKKLIEKHEASLEEFAQGNTIDDKVLFICLSELFRMYL